MDSPDLDTMSQILDSFSELDSEHGDENKTHAKKTLEDSRNSALPSLNSSWSSHCSRSYKSSPITCEPQPIGMCNAQTLTPYIEPIQEAHTPRNVQLDICDDLDPEPQLNDDNRAPSPDEFASSPIMSPREIQSVIGRFSSLSIHTADWAPPGTVMDEYPPLDLTTAFHQLYQEANAADAAEEICDGDKNNDSDNVSHSSSTNSTRYDSESHPEANSTNIISPRFGHSESTTQLIIPEVTVSPNHSVVIAQQSNSLTPVHSLSTKHKQKHIKLDLLALSPPPGEDNRTPSPLFGRRSPLGTLGWRPVMPGYHPPRNDNQKLVLNGQEADATNQAVRGQDMSLKDYIPMMPKPVAVVCLILNVVSPGLGTLLAGVSVVCCSSPRPVGTERVHCLWVNTWVAVLQILTTFLVLLGWIWSIMWGIAFLTVADHSKKEKVVELDAVDTISHRIDGAHARSRGQPGMESHIQGHTQHPSSLSYPASHYRQSGQTDANMIILQDTPLILDTLDQQHMDINRTQNQRTYNPYNPRHQRILMRRQVDEVLPSYLLDSHALENIVIRNAPILDQMVFGRAEATPAGGTDYDRFLPKGYTGTPWVPNDSEASSSGTGRHSVGQGYNRADASRRRESHQRLL